MNFASTDYSKTDLYGAWLSPIHSFVISIMMVITEIRRNNARQLARSEKRQKDFAAKINREETYVSKIIGENPTTNIGDTLARLIEKSYKKSEGWLDQDHTFHGVELRASTNHNNQDIFDAITKVGKHQPEKLFAIRVLLGLETVSISNHWQSNN